VESAPPHVGVPVHDVECQLEFFEEFCSQLTLEFARFAYKYRGVSQGGFLLR
jgi:hypothetical protein